jgi:hypothetical protein
MDHPARAEHVDLEHLANLGLFALFDGGEVADAGVVHQHVDPAEPLLGGRDGRCDLVRLGHVELQHHRVLGGGIALECRHVTRRHHGSVAVLDGLFGQFAAEAARTACDEPDGRFGHEQSAGLGAH